MRRRKEGSRGVRIKGGGGGGKGGGKGGEGGEKEEGGEGKCRRREGGWEKEGEVRKKDKRYIVDVKKEHFNQNRNTYAAEPLV